MTLRNAISIAIPAVALLIVLAAPGQARWARRPWLIKQEPRRAAVAAVFTALLIIAIIHAVT